MFLYPQWLAFKVSEDIELNMKSTTYVCLQFQFSESTIVEFKDDFQNINQNFLEKSLKILKHNCNEPKLSKCSVSAGLLGNVEDVYIWSMVIIHQPNMHCTKYNISQWDFNALIDLSS